MSTYIEVNNLSKSYETPVGEVNIFEDVNLSIGKGEVVGLVGASGVGKTTFLNMLTAIDSPNGGEVIIDGFNVTKSKKAKVNRFRATQIGIVFQFFQLIPTVSVLQNIIAPMDLTNSFAIAERKPRAMELLDRLGIANQAEKLPTMLSGGQQQRVAIARALANDPPLLIGDELTANLDRKNAENVFDILAEYSQDRGTTIIVVSYDRDLLSNVSTLFELRNHDIQTIDPTPQTTEDQPVAEPMVRA